MTGATRALGRSRTQVQSLTELDECRVRPRSFLRRNPGSTVEFHELVDHLLKKGAAERVLHCCHQLIGEESDPDSEVVAQLTALVKHARNSLITAMS